MIRSALRWSWRGLARVAKVFLLGLLSYLVVAWLLCAIPVNASWQPAGDGVPIWVACPNGLHVDLLMPAKTADHDWTTELPAQHFRRIDPDANYIGFGWGDRGFYLERTEISNVNPTTALVAMSHLGRSLMHVYYMELPATNSRQCRLLISRDQHRALVAYIRASFARDQQQRPILIPDAGHGNSDAFYEGVGRYGLFYTCNTWVNSALRRIGLPTALYAVFACGLMDHLQGR